jgi:murein DD-endopeptidase MepM/ murein hydrolase activator NlpD
MRVFLRTRRDRTFLTAFGAIVAALVLAWPSVLPAEASEASLNAAQDAREAVEQRLDEVLARLDQLEAETAQIEARVAQLRGQAEDYEDSATQAQKLMQARVEDAYKRGRMPIALAFFTAGKVSDAVDRARLLALMAQRHSSVAETASAASIRANASAEQVAGAVELLEAHEAELAQARDEVGEALAQAQAREEEIRAEIAAEEAAAARAARERAARSSSVSTTSVAAVPAPSGAGAPVSGGIACPVGSPRSYSDTYGAPRSGGRSHLGTDILAPMGTPSYAYEPGVIDNMWNSSLGGTSLYLRGDSGNLYFYTHLSGYAADSAVGKHVSAGALVAYVGDSGNAAGIPHLHFEVMPGGGSNVNPYPYVLRACG